MMSFKQRSGIGPDQMSPMLAAFTVIGVLLMFVGVALLALTENALKDYRLAMVRHGGEIQHLDAANGSNGHLEGRMVRVHGVLQVPVPPRDPEFGQSATTAVLIRHVAMFQWRQIDIGGPVHYELDWVDHPVDARNFVHPRGHANPAQFPIEGRQFDARQVQVNGMTLSSELVHAIPGSAMITPDVDQLPPNLAATFSLRDHYLVTSARPDSPALGDLRLGWEIVPLQSVSVVAMLKGKQLQRAPYAQEEKGFQLQLGDRSLLDLFPDLPLPPEAVTMRRGVAIILVLVGALLLFTGRRRPLFDLLLPMGTALLLTGAVAAFMWLGATGTGMSLRWAGCALVGCVLMAGPLWRRHRSGQAPAG